MWTEVSRVKHTGLSLKMDKLLQLGQLILAFARAGGFKGKKFYRFTGAEIVWNDFDCEYQLQSFYIPEGGQETEGDLIALVDNTLVAVLNCDRCSNPTNTLYWEAVTYTEQICQLCLEAY
jgi:hypothetical protein